MKSKADQRRCWHLTFQPETWPVIMSVSLVLPLPILIFKRKKLTASYGDGRMMERNCRREELVFSS